GHFSTCRPKFYAEVEKQTGFRLRQGTLNILCEPDVFGTIPEPRLRIDGVDQIDIEAKQDLLIEPCSIRGVQGYRILPVVRPNTTAGHNSESIIEISLAGELSGIHDGDQLEVSFPDGRS